MTDADELHRVELALADALRTINRLRSEIAGGEVAPAGPAQSDWITIAEAAYRLRVSETTAWRHAVRYGANWTHPGVRLVDFEKLKKVRPPRD